MDELQIPPVCVHVYYKCWSDVLFTGHFYHFLSRIKWTTNKNPSVTPSIRMSQPETIDHDSIKFANGRLRDSLHLILARIRQI
jgi:hypothetical protein